MAKRILAVFDFDKTVLSGNSDVIIANLLPKDVLHSEELKSLRPTWTEYMAKIFQLLPKYGYTQNTISDICQKFSPNDGMLDLFRYLRTKNSEIIILSDANDFMISTWFDYNLPDVKIDRIITNPTQWEHGDVLRVSPYENQTTCDQCAKNLCKGTVLLKIIQANHYDFVMYAGDGKNDWCPSSKLKTGDMVFARKNHQLEELLQQKPVTASCFIWETAHEILKQLQAMN